MSKVSITKSSLDTLAQKISAKITGTLPLQISQMISIVDAIVKRTSSDLTASGATVTAPSGYYASNATKSVPSGSANPAANISATGASVSTGTNTLTLSKSVSNTPQVTAGYVASGTTGDSSVSLTASVTTKAAATIYPSASDQSIAASQYLTGAQTIKAVTTSNLAADNIKQGVTVTVGDSADADRILSVTGTYSGGGSSGIGTLLATKSLGSISTSSTSAADTGQTVSVTGYDGYNMLVVVTSCTKTNGRHYATINTVMLAGTSAIETINAVSLANATLNIKLSSSGTVSSRASTTKYGIYVNSASISGSTITLAMYQRYNSNNTGTINGSYTVKVYGVKIYDYI